MRQTRARVEKADSITFVLASVKRSCCGTCSRWTVSVSSSPSAQTAGSARIEVHEFVMQSFQRLPGASVLFQGVGRVQLSGHCRLLLVCQVIEHVAPLVNLAALDRC